MTSLLATLLAAIFAAPANADTIPPPNESSWVASGAATLVPPPKSYLILTPDTGGSAGSVIYKTPISPDHLTVGFDETMECESSNCNGADGIAFDILDASGLSSPPTVGEGGGALGFYPNRGLAVTLTQNSAPWGCYPADHFIGIADSEPPNGCPLHYLDTAAGIPELHNATNHVVIELDRPTESITVSINGTQYLSYSGPWLSPGGSAYIGFSAGTGIGAEEHVVSDVSIVEPTPTPAPPSPGPAPPLGPVGPPAAAGCPDVAIYGVRGSGEDYRKAELGMGTAVHSMAARLVRQIPSAYSVLQAGVPYKAANALFAIANDSPLFLGAEPYNESVEEGADLLVNGRPNSGGISGFTGIGQLAHKCHQVKLALIGLSQGAQVITTALAQAHRPTMVTKRIRAILLYGNPIRRRNQPYDVGTNAHNGLLFPADLQPGGSSWEMPRFMWPGTRSYCLTHDPFCAFSPDDFLHHRDVHNTYASSQFARQGIEFAIRAIEGH